MLHAEPQAVAPGAGAGGADFENGVAGAIVQHPGAGAVADRHPYDQGLGPAIEEELPHAVGERTVAVEAAVAALEIGEAGDGHSLVGHALARIADEGGDGGRDTGDGAYPAGLFDDVDTGIADLDHDADSFCAVQGTQPGRRRKASLVDSWVTRFDFGGQGWSEYRQQDAEAAGHGGEGACFDRAVVYPETRLPPLAFNKLGES
ncbi:hypothetical protein D3C84_634100 [compost metagenome]